MIEGPGRRPVAGFCITAPALLYTVQLRKHAASHAWRCWRCLRDGLKLDVCTGPKGRMRPYVARLGRLSSCQHWLSCSWIDVPLMTLTRFSISSASSAPTAGPLGATSMPKLAAGAAPITRFREPWRVKTAIGTRFSQLLSPSAPRQRCKKRRRKVKRRRPAGKHLEWQPLWLTRARPMGPKGAAALGQEQALRRNPAACHTARGTVSTPKLVAAPEHETVMGAEAGKQA